MRNKQWVAAASAGLIGLGLLGLAWTSYGAEPDKSEKKAEPPKFDPTSAVAVQQLREQALNVLSAALESPGAEERANAIEALLPAAQRAEPAIRKGLRDVTPGVRAVAAMGVGKIKLNRLIEEVRPLLDDNSEFSRMGAIFAFAKCNVSVDQSALAGYLLNGRTPRIKAQAAYLLGEIGNKSAAPLLREALSKRVGRADLNEDRLMRLQINEALVKLGDDAALDEIRIAIYPSKSEDLEAAVLAAQILGVLKDRASQRKLIELVETTVRTESSRSAQMPPEVRLAAAGALARMGQVTGAVAIADEYRTNSTPAVRAQAAVVYGDSHNRPQLGRLAGMIDDPDPTVRLAVAAAILKIIDGDPVAR